MLSCRTVGVKTDDNFCPYLLSPTAPAPRTRLLAIRSLALLGLLRVDQQIQ